jgi:uncharacterized protein YciW
MPDGPKGQSQPENEPAIVTTPDAAHKRNRRMAAMLEWTRSVIPPLGAGDQKVSEHLDARD